MSITKREERRKMGRNKVKCRKMDSMTFYQQLSWGTISCTIESCWIKLASQMPCKWLVLWVDHSTLLITEKDTLLLYGINRFVIFYFEIILDSQNVMSTRNFHIPPNNTFIFIIFSVIYTYFMNHLRISCMLKSFGMCFLRKSKFSYSHIIIIAIKKLTLIQC